MGGDLCGALVGNGLRMVVWVAVVWMSSGLAVVSFSSQWTCEFDSDRWHTNITSFLPNSIPSATPVEQSIFLLQPLP